MTWAFIFFNSDFCWWYRSYYCLKRQLHLLLYHDGCWGYTSVFWWEKLLDDICIHGCLCPDPISTYLNQLCQLHSYCLESTILKVRGKICPWWVQMSSSNIIFLKIRLALSRETILQRASFADIVSVNKDTWKEVVGGVPNLIKKMRSCSK